MTTWRGVRKELVGAWRSVQYDLTRARRRRADGAEETTELIFPEHTGTPTPRRLVATSGFAMVSIAGAIGTYFAVVNGLGALLDTGPAAEEEAPASVVAGAAGTGQRPREASPDRPMRIARQGGPLTVAGRQAASGGAGSLDTHDGAPTGGGPAPDLVRNPGAPAPEQSDASEDPTDEPVPTASPTPAEPTPTGEPTQPNPTQEPSVSPSASEQQYEGRHRHRHHRRHHRDENP